MNVRALREFPSVLLMAAFFAVFVSHLDQPLWARGFLPFKNVSMFLWGLAAVTAGSVLRAAGSARERARFLALYRSHLAVLAPLTAVVLGSFASAFLPTANLDEGPRYVFYPAYDATIIVLSMLLPFQEHHRRWIRRYLAIAFALAAAGVFVDVIRPGTFSLQPDRAAGFAQNPNGGSFLLVALCCSLIVFDRVRSVDLVILGVTALGVLATLSRGGAVLFAFVVCCYAPNVVRHAARRGVGVVLTRVVALLVLVAGTSVAASRLIHQRMFAGPGSRIEMLLGNREVVGPRESRLGLLAESWELVREAPILGYGSGFTFAQPQGPHNMYLSRWLDNGLAGLASFVWLLAASCLTFWRRRHATGLVFMAVMVIEGFFSHNLLEERAFLLVLGVLLTLSAYGVTEGAAAPQRVRRRRRPAVGLLESASRTGGSAPVPLPSAGSPRPR